MKLFFKTIFSFAMLVSSSLSVKAQDVVNVTIQLVSVQHNFQCCTDAAGFSCGFLPNKPEPRYRVRAQTILNGTGAGFGATTTINPGNGVTCGTIAATNTILNLTGVCADEVELDIDMWEEDGCGSDNDFNTGCANDDENRTQVSPNHVLSGLLPGVPNSFSATGSGGYVVNYTITYTVVAAPVNTSTITTGCPGDAANLSATIAQTVAGMDFIWYDAATGGTVEGNGSPFTPTLSTSKTYYVAYGNVATCETARTAVAVTVATNSVVPTSITPSSAALCGPGTISLTANGGTAGTTALYQWYDDNCGGNLIGTTAGATLTGVNVTATTTYFVRLSGTCNTTACAQVSVPVTTPSTAPTGATTSIATICNGTAVDLNVVGGSLGTSSTWEWYSGSCGTGVSVGSGASINVTPSATTTYYVRDEGGCGPTACQNVTVTVQSLSTAATSVSASATTICAGGGPVTLDVVGGSLGTGADWQWYETGCGSGAVGNGSQLIISPTTTTTYYVRAEGSCNNTTCATVTITVQNLSTAPTGVLTASSNLCLGQTAVLNVSGGSLGTGANWEWYEGSCGGVFVGSGNAVSVAPAVTTTYFVRAEGTCNNTACATVTITIGNGAADPSSATASVNNICPETTVTLTAVSAIPLPTGYIYVWYTGACGAVPVGVGQTLDVIPTATTTYYVRAVGTCGASLCASVTVTVLPGSVTPAGVLTDNNNFCVGSTANLSVDGGTLEAGAQWTWYENSCGGAAIGTGSTIAVTPNNSTTYYVRGEGGACGNTDCATISLNVFSTSVYLVPFDTVCINNATAFNLTGGLPLGGSYSGTGVVAGQFTASSAGLGSHVITYTYADGNGCSNTATENIVVVESNVAATSITASNTVVCNAGSVTLTVNGGALVTGADWVWYENSCGGGTSVGNGTTISVSPTQSTTYFVRAEGGNTYCGPSSCVAKTISVSNPSVAIVPFESVCGTSLVTLNNGIPSGGVYSGTGVTGNQFDAAIAGSGVHNIVYTYTDGNGCTANGNADITVLSSNLTLTTSIETESCADGGILIHAFASGGDGFYSYIWSDGSNENPHIYTEPGTYSVEVSDGSGCGAAVTNIEVSEDLACLEIANTFTPNGDGTNDTWNLDFTLYASAKVQVFSKWGVLVHETNDITIHWDGSGLNGEQLPAGTYYYIVELDGGSITQNGPISIVR